MSQVWPRAKDCILGVSLVTILQVPGWPHSFPVYLHPFSKPPPGRALVTTFLL